MKKKQKNEDLGQGRPTLVLKGLSNREAKERLMIVIDESLSAVREMAFHLLNEHFDQYSNGDVFKLFEDAFNVSMQDIIEDLQCPDCKAEKEHVH